MIFFESYVATEGVIGFKAASDDSDYTLLTRQDLFLSFSTVKRD